MTSNFCPHYPAPAKKRPSALRRDRREMHLQYLRPPMRQAEAEAYDYFLLTAGPMTLAERHAALGTRKRTPA